MTSLDNIYQQIGRQYVLNYVAIGSGLGKLKPKKCVKGWNCGYSCQSKDKKNCKSGLDGQAKTYAEWLSAQSTKTPAKKTKQPKQKAVKPAKAGNVQAMAEEALAAADAIIKKPFSERKGDEQGLGGPTERLREGLDYLKTPTKFSKASVEDQIGVIDMLASTHGSNNAIPRDGNDAASVALRVTAARAEIANKLYSGLSNEQKELFVAQGGGKAFADLEGRNPAYTAMRNDIKKRYEDQLYKADMERKAKKASSKNSNVSDIDDPFDLL